MSSHNKHSQFEQGTMGGTIFGIISDGETLRPAAGDVSIAAGLHRALTTLPEGAPITILVHGFKWSPFAADLGDATRNPLSEIFAPTPRSRCFKVVSWPAGLGFTSGPQAGLCIPFAWPALSPATLGRVPTSGFREIYERAGEAGAALARLVRLIHVIAPERAVDVVAHSLGARVALQAITHGARFDRVVFLSGAEGEAAARAVLDTAPGTDFFNVTTRANAFYDALFALSVPCSGKTLGRMQGPEHMVSIQMDRWPVRDALAQLGHPIAAPDRRMCHWSTYTAKGALRFYGSLLRERSTLTRERVADHIETISRVRAL